MDYQYNYEKTAQQIMKTTQAQGGMERKGKQALKDQPRALTRLTHHLAAVWKKLSALFKKETILNN